VTLGRSGKLDTGACVIKDTVPALPVGTSFTRRLSTKGPFTAGGASTPNRDTAKIQGGALRATVSVGGGHLVTLDVALTVSAEFLDRTRHR
jgi:hypothetical protein